MFHQTEEGRVLLRKAVSKRAFNFFLCLFSVNLVEEFVVIPKLVIVGANGVDLQTKTRVALLDGSK